MYVCLFVCLCVYVYTCVYIYIDMYMSHRSVRKDSNEELLFKSSRARAWRLLPSCPGGSLRPVLILFQAI